MPLVALSAAGIAVSFLGAFFYYGTLHSAVSQAIPPTIEALQYEPEWNHIRFNGKLLQEWVVGSNPEEPASWPPPRHRWFPNPGQGPIAYPERTVALRDYAHPQPLLLRDRAVVKSAALEPSWYVFLNCLWLGPVLLIWLARLILRMERLAQVERPDSTELSSEALEQPGTVKL
jgi:hypothetical protein